MTIQKRIRDSLEARKQKGEYRSLSLPDDGIDFTSNDYLGLSRSAWIADRTRADLEENGIRRGATGSRLLSGNSVYAMALEERIAAIHEAESALLVSSGYAANLGLISTLCREGDIALYDEGIHASMHQGLALGKAHAFPFAHNDVEALRSALEQHLGKQVFVFLESVYSMDGDHAPLAKICALKKTYDFELVVDEAHALGIFGKGGRGYTEATGTSGHCLARVYTFGKAFGTQGAVIAGPSWLKEYLVNFCKPLIYSTAPDLPSLVAVEHSYKFSLKFDYQRNRLIELISYMKSVFQGENRRFLLGDGPVFGLLTGPPERTRSAARLLGEAGFYVRPIVYPTVPRGGERIRISLHSFNTEAQIDALFSAWIKLPKS